MSHWISNEVSYPASENKEQTCDILPLAHFHIQGYYFFPSKWCNAFQSIYSFLIKRSKFKENAIF